MRTRWVPGVLLFVAALVLSVAPSGCRKETTTSKGERELSIKVDGSATMDQGDTDKVTITAERDGFDEPIRITIKDMPKGLKVIDEDIEIEKGSKEVEVTFKADDNAEPVENHTVKVDAKAGDLTATETIKITIRKKE